MFGMFGSPFEQDSMDYYDPYTQYYRQRRAEEQRYREQEMRRKQQLQRQMYYEQLIREQQREQEERRQRQLEERLAREARELREREKQQLRQQQLQQYQQKQQEMQYQRQKKMSVPIYDTNEQLYYARNSVPNRFEEGKIVNNEAASEPSDAFKTFDPENTEENVKMFAKDPESQKGFVRTGDVYSVSVRASSRSAATVEANAAGDLQIIADGKKYSFKLPAYTDRSSIRAKWSNGTLLVQVDVPSNPEQDVFVVRVE